MATHSCWCTASFVFQALKAMHAGWQPTCILGLGSTCILYSELLLGVDLLVCAACYWVAYHSEQCPLLHATCYRQT